MKILALDTSQIQAAVCLLVVRELCSGAQYEDQKVLASETGQTSVAHSEALLPLIDRVTQKRLNEIDAFAVAVGPGSFTGIRIGCATIKGLAQVLKKDILPFSSLKALAFSEAEVLNPSVVAMANAYQGQVFVGWMDQQGVWQEDAQTVENWCQKNLHSGLVRICGTGAQVFKEALLTHKEISLSSVQYATPLGVLRAVTHELNANPKAFVHYTQLQANYMRPSQAEAKLQSGVAK